MKTLKYFILLIGLFVLTHTNLNAQIGTATATEPISIPDITMALPMSVGTVDGSPLASNYAVAYSSFITPTTVRAEFTAHLTSNVEVILAIRVYDGDTLLEEYTSEYLTRSYQFDVTFNYTHRLNPEFYIQCGYYEDSNSSYQADSGCVVVIEPL